LEAFAEACPLSQMEQRGERGSGFDFRVPRRATKAQLPVEARATLDAQLKAVFQSGGVVVS
jgi:hypothetical protein